MSDAKDKGPQQIKIGVRQETKAKFDAEADRIRVPLVEMADLAIDAWRLLSKEQQDSIVDRSHQSAA